MPPANRKPFEDAEALRQYDLSGRDIAHVARHFEITELEAIAAVLSGIRGTIPRKPPGGAMGLFVVPKREAA